jgi:ATP-dependent protease ClpP protease subunit
MGKKSDNHSLFANKRGHTLHRLFLDALDEYNEVELHELYNELMEATPNDLLEVRINSHGGFLKPGHAIGNIITDKFQHRCITVIDSIALSMSALLFLKGSERIVYSHSQLMFHEISAGYNGKSSDINNEIEFKNPLFKKEMKMYVKPYLTKKEWKSFNNGKDIWLNAHEMCKRGIATKININGTILEAKDYVKETKN